MELIINDDYKIGALKDFFSLMFPFLKIELYAHSKKKSSLSCNSVIPATNLLKSHRIINSGDAFVITPQTTVTELDKTFEKIYGIKAKILRKSGNAWLETSFTESWTLELQNRQGEELSK